VCGVHLIRPGTGRLVCPWMRKQTQGRAELARRTAQRETEYTHLPREDRRGVDLIGSLASNRWRLAVVQAGVGALMWHGESNGGGEFPIAPEHEMLLRMRDTLYEGDWGDFTRDLRARLSGKPYVYEVVPASPRMKSTIMSHLRLIEQMEAWERDHGRTLRVTDAGTQDGG